MSMWEMEIKIGPTTPRQELDYVLPPKQILEFGIVHYPLLLCLWLWVPSTCGELAVYG